MKTQVTIKRWDCRCNMCDHQWRSGSEAVPPKCPRCQSTLWDRESLKDHQLPMTPKKELSNKGIHGKLSEFYRKGAPTTQQPSAVEANVHRSPP